MKIYLIGYMGSGKSTVGNLLADQMKLNFRDFDKYIEHETGKTIAEIFDTDGEDKFREMEHHYLKKCITTMNEVVSLGGGTPCFYDNIELINQTGISVYLKVRVDLLVKRLSTATNKRPLIRDLSATELQYFIETNLEKRKSIYGKAHYTITADDRNASEIVNDIIKKIK
jgi:shikimate kinase